MMQRRRLLWIGSTTLMYALALLFFAAFAACCCACNSHLLRFSPQGAVVATGSDCSGTTGSCTVNLKPAATTTYNNINFEASADGYVTSAVAKYGTCACWVVCVGVYVCVLGYVCVSVFISSISSYAFLSSDGCDGDPAHVHVCCCCERCGWQEPLSHCGGD